MQMGGSEMPMQPAQLNEALGELYRHPVYLALNHETRNAEYMGMGEIDVKEYDHIRLEEEIVLNICLDPETALPEVTTLRQFNPQMGDNIDIKTESSE